VKKSRRSKSLIQQKPGGELAFDHQQAQKKHTYNQCRRHSSDDNPENRSVPWGVIPIGFRAEEIPQRSSQDGFVRLQIFFDGLDRVAGIGDADGVWLAEFVMHEQFADHSHLKIRIGHAPELAVFQWLLANAWSGLNFYHAQCCALTFD
jgi:hypothetical protein